jgi:hypothetical protein
MFFKFFGYILNNLGVFYYLLASTTCLSFREPFVLILLFNVLPVILLLKLSYLPSSTFFNILAAVMSYLLLNCYLIKFVSNFFMFYILLFSIFYFYLYLYTFFSAVFEVTSCCSLFLLLAKLADDPLWLLSLKSFKLNRGLYLFFIFFFSSSLLCF